MTEQGRVRSVRWRRFGGLALLVVALFGLTGLVQGVGSHGGPVVALLVGGAGAAAALALYRWATGRIERRAVRELPTRPAGLGTGTLIGIGLCSLTIALIALFGGYRVAGWGSFGGLLTAVGLMAGAAVIEELIFRGVVFRVVEEHTGTRVALAISAGLFGLLHLANPDATVVGALAIAVEAGLMLGAAYVWTRSLWLPIGIHFGWNVAEGGIFGSTVSGSGDEPNGLLDGVAKGSQVISGGTFGPEGSILAVLVGIAATLVFLRLARRNAPVG